MTVHLIKMSVGVEDIRHLERIQAKRLADAKRRGVAPELMHITRNTPRRAAEVLRGGSIFWVIKRFISVRQVIADLRQVEGKQPKRDGQEPGAEQRDDLGGKEMAVGPVRKDCQHQRYFAIFLNSSTVPRLSRCSGPMVSSRQWSR